jgi:osmotically-inducible protein OsmY
VRKQSVLRTVVGLAGASLLIVPATTLGDTYSRSATYGRHDLSSDQFVTQAERDLAERVRADLSVNPALASAIPHLRIGVDQGRVTLQGPVQNEQTREQILARARQTLGVTQVRNELQTVGDRVASETPGEQPPAEATTQERVLRDQEARDREQGPTRRGTTAGVVTGSDRAGDRLPARYPAMGSQERTAVGDPHLPGSGSMHESDRTGTTGPTGTRSFTPNSGSVDPLARTTKPAGDYAKTTADRNIAAAVRLALNGNPAFAVTDENVHVTVDNGEVTLQGWVRNEGERRAITTTVGEVAGVQRVNNRLQVRSGMTVTQ